MVLKRFWTKVFFIFVGEINGKIQAQAQSRQQKKTCKMESKAQNKLIIGDALCVLSIAQILRNTTCAIRNTINETFQCYFQT